MGLVDERFSSGQRTAHLPWAGNGRVFYFQGFMLNHQGGQVQDSESMRLLLGPLLTSSCAMTWAPKKLAVWVSRGFRVSGRGEDPRESRGLVG